jgi:DNA-binding CsgD family transcriptional regulator
MGWAMMRISEETFTGLVAELYEAGFGRTDWAPAVRSIAGAFGGAGSVVFDLNPGSGEVSNWIGPGLESGADEYARYANAINPRMHFSLAAPAGHVAWDYRFLSESGIRKHAFYDWTMRFGGVRYFIGTRLFDDLESNTSTFTSVEFTPRHGHVTREMIETFAQLKGHIANAWRLNRLMHRRRAGEEIETLMESHAACGLIVFDSMGRIRSVNDHAAAILAQDDGLVIRDGTLMAQLAGETHRLQVLLQACWKTSMHGLGSPGGAVAITRRSGQPRYVVRAMPVTVPAAPFPSDLPAIIVTILDPVLPIDVEPEMLAELYGLTRREADLAVQLSAGLALREAAAAAGMRYNTARNHIRPLFEKTGAKSQLQLVSILRGLAPLR